MYKIMQVVIFYFCSDSVVSFGIGGVEISDFIDRAFSYPYQRYGKPASSKQ
jgi:hypothetical protein